jgi:acyl carrier protein
VDRSQLLEIVREAVALRAGTEAGQLHEGTAFADLGLDSLALVELTADVEEAAGGRLLEVHALYATTNVGGYVDLLAAALSGRPAPA